MIERLVHVVAELPIGPLDRSPRRYSVFLRSASDPWRREWREHLRRGLLKSEPRLADIPIEDIVLVRVHVVERREVAEPPSLPVDMALDFEVIEPAEPMQDALEWMPRMPKWEVAA